MKLLIENFISLLAIVAVAVVVLLGVDFLFLSHPVPVEQATITFVSPEPNLLSNTYPAVVQGDDTGVVYAGNISLVQYAEYDADPTAKTTIARNCGRIFSFVCSVTYILD